jgi:hypothetical protein
MVASLPATCLPINRRTAVARALRRRFRVGFLTYLFRKVGILVLLGSDRASGKSLQRPQTHAYQPTHAEESTFLQKHRSYAKHNMSKAMRSYHRTSFLKPPHGAPSFRGTCETFLSENFRFEAQCDPGLRFCQEKYCSTCAGVDSGC